MYSILYILDNSSNNLTITFLFIRCVNYYKVYLNYIFCVAIFCKSKIINFCKILWKSCENLEKIIYFRQKLSTKKTNILEKISHFCSNWLTAIFFAVMDKCPKTQNVNFWKHYKMQRIIYCSRFQDMNEGWVVSDERWAMNDEVCGVGVDRWEVRGERLGMRG